MDAHAEDEVEAVGRRHDLLDARLGIERQADLEAMLAGLRGQRRRIVDGLEVERDAVASGLLDQPKMMLGLVDHQVAVEHALLPVDERRDRLEHDGADRDRLDEVPVADVEVEDARPGAQQDLDLLAEAREVGRVQGRLHLDRADPAIPSHAPDLRAQRTWRRASVARPVPGTIILSTAGTRGVAKA